MTGNAWPLVEAASRLLKLEDREAVLGDLLETSEGVWRALLGVLGLIIRQQGILWRSWRPWLAGFGVALPSSLLLMGTSLCITQTFLSLVDPQFYKLNTVTGAGFFGLVCHVLLMFGWSWAPGFVVGTISRRTLWVSAALCCSPCLFCLARFRLESLSKFCLLLFLLPAFWGVWRGLHVRRIKPGPAAVLAIAVTALTLATWTARGQRWESPSSWFLHIGLVWPVWYLFATAWGSDHEGRISLWRRPFDRRESASHR